MHVPDFTCGDQYRTLLLCGVPPLHVQFTHRAKVFNSKDLSDLTQSLLEAQLTLSLQPLPSAVQVLNKIQGSGLNYPDKNPPKNRIQPLDFFPRKFCLCYSAVITASKCITCPIRADDTQ